MTPELAARTAREFLAPWRGYTQDAAIESMVETVMYALWRFGARPSSARVSYRSLVVSYGVAPHMLEVSTQDNENPIICVGMMRNFFEATDVRPKQ